MAFFCFWPPALAQLSSSASEVALTPPRSSQQHAAYAVQQPAAADAHPAPLPNQPSLDQPSCLFHQWSAPAVAEAAQDSLPSGLQPGRSGADTATATAVDERQPSLAPKRHCPPLARAASSLASACGCSSARPSLEALVVAGVLPTGRLVVSVGSTQVDVCLQPDGALHPRPLQPRQHFPCRCASRPPPLPPTPPSFPPLPAYIVIARHHPVRLLPLPCRLFLCPGGAAVGAERAHLSGALRCTHSNHIPPEWSSKHKKNTILPIRACRMRNPRRQSADGWQEVSWRGQRLAAYRAALQGAICVPLVGPEAATAVEDVAAGAALLELAVAAAGGASNVGHGGGC